MVELDADSSCFFFFRVFSDLFFFLWKNFGTKNQLDNRGVMLVVVLKVSKKPRRMDKCDIKKMVAVLRSAGIRIRWSMPILHSL